MLQRIQTVYLLIIAILTALMSLFPLAVLQTGDTLYEFTVFGVKAMTQEAELVYPIWSLFALTTIIAGLAIIAILLFKKRMLQIRICVFNAFVMIGLYGFFAYLVYAMKQQLGDLSISVRFALSFPLICLILDYLAIRKIGADEILVRSLDRLR